MSDMTPEQARKICATVVAGRAQWAVHYKADDVGLHNLLDALVVLAREQEHRDQELRDELTKARRQLAAMNARLQKAKKRGLISDEEGDADEQQEG